MTVERVALADSLLSEIRPCERAVERPNLDAEDVRPVAQVALGDRAGVSNRYLAVFHQLVMQDPVDVLRQADAGIVESLAADGSRQYGGERECAGAEDHRAGEEEDLE